MQRLGIKNSRRGWRQESHKLFACLTMKNSTLHASHVHFFHFCAFHSRSRSFQGVKWSLFSFVEDVVSCPHIFVFSFYSSIPFHQFNPLIDKQSGFEKSEKYYRKAELHFRRRPLCLPPSLSFLWKLQNRWSSAVDWTRTVQRWNMLGKSEKLLFLLLNIQICDLLVAVVVVVA